MKKNANARLVVFNDVQMLVNAISKNSIFYGMSVITPTTRKVYFVERNNVNAPVKSILVKTGKSGLEIRRGEIELYSGQKYRGE